MSSLRPVTGYQQRTLARVPTYASALQSKDPLRKFPECQSRLTKARRVRYWLHLGQFRSRQSLDCHPYLQILRSWIFSRRKTPPLTVESKTVRIHHRTSCLLVSVLLLRALHLDGTLGVK